MPKYLINKNNLNLEAGVTQEEFDTLVARVDNIVAPQSSNVSGWVVASQSANAEQEIPGSGYRDFAKNFTLPYECTILEVSYILNDTTSIPNTTKETKDAYWSSDGQNNYFVVVRVTDASINLVSITITYAYADNVSMSEVTDIRVGYDGTVYNSAGDAVRAQAYRNPNLRVNITAEYGQTGDMYDITADHTLTEILAAANGGSFVYCVFNRTIIPLTIWGTNSARFSLYHTANGASPSGSYLNCYINFSGSSISGKYQDEL